MHGGQLFSKKNHHLHFMEMISMLKVDGDLEFVCNGELGQARRLDV